MYELPSPEASAAEYDYAQPLRTLHDTLQRTFLDAADQDGSIARQQTLLGAAVAEGHKANLDAYGHAMLDHYETVVDYVWFGGHEDEPPAAIGFYWSGYTDHREDWGTVELRPDVISRDTFDAITALLAPRGLGDLLKE